jgi:hypothetical protein
MERTCKKCGETKPIEEFLIFHKTAGYPTIHRSYCRDCRKIFSKEHYKKDPNGCQLRNLKWRKNNINKHRQSRIKRYKQNSILLTDEYVKMVLVSEANINMEVLNSYPEIVIAKREQLKLYRLIKNQK